MAPEPVLWRQRKGRDGALFELHIVKFEFWNGTRPGVVFVTVGLTGIVPRHVE